MENNLSLSLHVCLLKWLCSTTDCILQLPSRTAPTLGDCSSVSCGLSQRVASVEANQNSWRALMQAGIPGVTIPFPHPHLSCDGKQKRDEEEWIQGPLSVLHLSLKHCLIFCLFFLFFSHSLSLALFLSLTLSQEEGGLVRRECD